MKRLLLAGVVLVGITASCQSGGDGSNEARMKVEHDTIYTGDTVVVHDTVVVTKTKYYEGRLIKQKYDSCEWKQMYESYDYGFVICSPEFMEKNLKLTTERSVVMEYGDIRLMAKAYEDKMSLEKKYQELNKSANTKSIGENYFMIAGRMGDEGRYFEKNIKMDGYWLYIRAEFPQPLAPYIDPLLQYVKNYGTSE